MKKLIFLSALCILFVGKSIAQVTPGYNIKIPEKIMTPNKVDTRIGELEFYDGIPMDATLEKVYENLDFIRGVDVFLNFIPTTSIEGMRFGMLELGLDN